MIREFLEQRDRRNSRRFDAAQEAWDNMAPDDDGDPDDGDLDDFIEPDDDDDRDYDAECYDAEWGGMDV